MHAVKGTVEFSERIKGLLGLVAKCQAPKMFEMLMRLWLKSYKAVAHINSTN